MKKCHYCGNIANKAIEVSGEKYHRDMTFKRAGKGEDIPICEKCLNELNKNQDDK